MNRFSYMLIVSVTCLLSACDRWPPYRDDLVEHFNENKDAFEQLRAKIIDTHYLSVGGGCIGDRDGGLKHTPVTFTWEPDHAEGEDFVYEQESVEDAEWSELFCKVGGWDVVSYDGIVRFEFGGPSAEQNDRSVRFAYVHSKEMLASRIACLPEHKEIPCGLCSVALDDEWYVEYWWSPEELLPGVFDRVLDGEMTREEYRSMFDETLAQCRIDGNRAMGYDLDSLDQRGSEAEE